MANSCERTSRIRPQNETTCDWTDRDLSRLLLRKHGKRTARSSGRMAQDGMAETRTVEASPTDYQRLCRAMRRSECSCHHYFFGNRVVREYRQDRAISQPAGMGCPLQGCGRDVSSPVR